MNSAPKLEELRDEWASGILAEILTLQRMLMEADEVARRVIERGKPPVGVERPLIAVEEEITAALSQLDAILERWRELVG